LPDVWAGQPAQAQQVHSLRARSLEVHRAAADSPSLERHRQAETMKRYNRNTRDANEQPLVQLSEGLGGWWREDGPLDGWVWIPRQARWMPVEIKMPEREGTAHEYTPAQQRFFRWARERAAPWFVWRTEADVIRDIAGRAR
jgi:hypothetical protein